MDVDDDYCCYVNDGGLFLTLSLILGVVPHSRSLSLSGRPRSL